MKYYARIGRRFVQVKSAKGMFYNIDGTFTEKITNRSIGLCVHDDFEETIIASLKTSTHMTYDKAKKYCQSYDWGKTGGISHIPSIKESFMAFVTFGRPNNWIWADEDGMNFARVLDWSDGSVHWIDKRCRYCVKPFLTLKK